jgi:hypothetical protein
LDVRIDNPVIIIPHSAGNPLGIVVDLGQITATNTFKVVGSDGTISYQGLKTKSNPIRVRKESSGADPAVECGKLEENSPRLSRGKSRVNSVLVFPCLLDVISIDLINMDLFAAELDNMESSLPRPKKRAKKDDSDVVILGMSYKVRPTGPSFLKEKGRLKVQVERNLDGEMSHDSKSKISFRYSLNYIFFPLGLF